MSVSNRVIPLMNHVGRDRLANIIFEMKRDNIQSVEFFGSNVSYCQDFQINPENIYSLEELLWTFEVDLLMCEG